MKKQNVDETIAQICRIRPVLRPFLEIFGPLFAQRRATAERLAPLLAKAGIALSGMPGKYPLLQESLPANLGPFVRESAADLLPLLADLTAIAPYKEALSGLFLAEDNATFLQALAGAMLSPVSDSLVGLAAEKGIEPRILEFVSGFVVSAVLRGLTFSRKDEDYSDWRKSTCPVCGKPPIIAWLGRRPPVENNEFLADGGGRKHLHCGLCGTDWYFMRGVCPNCGTTGQDAMQILGEEDRRYERIDWCKNCHTYLPQIDLREIAGTPDMDVMAPGLMHLDLVAAEKELIPLKPSFWNMF